MARKPVYKQLLPDFLNAVQYGGHIAPFLTRHPKTVKKLVEYRDENGRTAFNEAIGDCYARDLALPLLQAGSNVNTPDNRGWTPLMRAVINPDSEQEMRRNVALLLEHGVNLHAEREDEGGKWTALMYAIEGPGKRFLPKMLIDRDPETLTRANENFMNIDAQKSDRRIIKKHDLHSYILSTDFYTPDGQKYEPIGAA